LKNTFLSAEWRKLILANHSVDPAILKPYLPARTELDTWNNTCYVSVVGFRFMHTRIKGIPIPFHTSFPEVNLRFYVRYKDNGEWKAGAVFIKEMVPKPAVTMVANTLFREHYVTLPMDYTWKEHYDHHEVAYRWKKNGVWNSVSVKAGLQLLDMPVGSEAEFMTEHYWGYTRLSPRQTSEYAVEHDRWQTYAIHDYVMDINFHDSFGHEFAYLAQEKPTSVFLAEGSSVRVGDGKRI
jgi:uncharacterized protein YqjF (DUF2071 family)